MEKRMVPSIEQAIELFDRQEYQGAFLAFVDVYQQSADSKERQTVLQILDEAYYAPNEMELHSNYEKNAGILKKYPYILGKQFRKFEDLSMKLFPISDEIFYCFDRDRECFWGPYEAKSRYQMRYFFENLDKPLRVEDEDNLYNLTFLDDNVRSSEDFARDNHVYLLYTTLEPLERLMLTCDLAPVLRRQKFVFLIGEKNWSRYPINFKKRYRIDYRKRSPAMLRIEEINRIYLNQFYAYSGTDFFEGVLNGSDHVLVLNGWFFYESPKTIVNTFLDYIHHPDREVSVLDFLKAIQQHVDDIKFNGWASMVQVLPTILKGRETAAVHELWKAIMISAMSVSQDVEKKQYLSRISPIIFFDPHGGPCSDYYELMKYFKYPAVEATIREPVVRFIRQSEVFGFNSLEGMRSCIRSTYEHSKDIPRWLTDSGFYVAKLEDLKLKPEQTLRTVCRMFNIPYTEKLLVGKIGMWGVLFTNEKGEQLQGFDQRSVRRDISDTVPPYDRERFDLYYWPILHYFRYPHAQNRKQLNKEEVEKLFSLPFRFEEIYAAQRAAYQQTLETSSPEDAEELRKRVGPRYELEPSAIRDMLQKVMVEDYMNGFDEKLVLPDVMFPEDEMELPPTQAQRLQEMFYE